MIDARSASSSSARVACGRTTVWLSTPLAATSTLGRSPACGPLGLLSPCCLPVGFQCVPAVEKSGGSHLPIGWTWMPWSPCGRPDAVTRKLTPPVVCQATTVPMVLQLWSISGVGAPPTGSRAVSHAVSAVAVRSGRRNSLRIGLDLDQQLPFGDLSAGPDIKFRDGAVERSGQRMLHLHRFQGEQALSLGNLFSLRNLD